MKGFVDGHEIPLLRRRCRLSPQIFLLALGADLLLIMGHLHFFFSQWSSQFTKLLFHCLEPPLQFFDLCIGHLHFQFHILNLFDVLVDFTLEKKLLNVGWNLSHWLRRTWLIQLTA